MSKIYPELKEHLLEVQSSLEQVASSWEKEPPKELKNKIMASIDEEVKNEKASSFAKKRAKVIRMQKAQNGRGINSRSVAAAAVILLLAAGALFFMKSNELNKVEAKLSALSDQVEAKEQLTAELSQKLDESEAQQAFLVDDRTLTVALAGTDNSPEASVKAYWNNSKGKVMLTGMNLPQNEIDKQYQLWAIVDGAPVDLGMLDANNPNLPLTKEVDAKNVQAFAITLETKGGNPAPNLEQLYVMGNVGS